MKKPYKNPSIATEANITPAGPLAFFSAATAAGAVAGLAAGAMGTKAMIRATPDEKRNMALFAVQG